MESQPQNPEFRINPENFHACLTLVKLVTPSPKNAYIGKQCLHGSTLFFKQRNIYKF